MAALEASRGDLEMRRTELFRLVMFIACFLALNILLGVFTGEKVVFLLKEELHLSAGTVTSLNLLIYASAYFQPVMGAATEIYPLFGSRRRSYFALATIFSSVIWLALALLPHFRVITVVCCLLLAAAGATLRVLLMNAVLVSLGNQFGNYKHIQTFRQMLPLLLVAGFAGHWGGIVTQNWTYRAAFLAASLISMVYLVLLPLIVEPSSAIDQGVRGVGDMDLGIAPATLPLTLHIELEAVRIRMRMLRAALKDRRLWAVGLFVAYFGLTPSPDTARPYYFVDALHFNKVLIGDLSGWGSAGAVLGILLIQFVPRTIRLRKLGFIAAVTSTLSLVPLLLIHDALSAKVGMTAFNLLLNACAFVYAWMWARACPKGLEAAVFGTLAAIQALFYYLCDWLGTHMYDWYGPASHHSAAHGWYWTLVTCILWCLPMFIIVLYLPKTDPADDHILETAVVAGAVQ